MDDRTFDLQGPPTSPPSANLGPVCAEASSLVPSHAPCAACAGASKSANIGLAPPRFVYALGAIEARAPNRSVEKEFLQALARVEATSGMTDRQAFHAVLSRRECRYLARQLCWTLGIQGVDAYILLPRDPADVDLLVECLQPRASPSINVVVGVLGPIAGPEVCNGLTVPIVMFDQLYDFDRHTLIASIPKPDNLSSDAFAAASIDLFDRVSQLSDNVGSADAHRALNYLAMRYPAIYAKVTEEFARNRAFDAVETLPSRLSGNRNVMDVIFSFTERTTGFTEKFFVRVDVTEEFPFLVTKLSPYFDR